MNIQENTFYYWAHSSLNHYIIYQLKGKSGTFFFNCDSKELGDSGSFPGQEGNAKEIRLATEEEKQLLIPFLIEKGVRVDEIINSYQIY